MVALLARPAVPITGKFRGGRNFLPLQRVCRRDESIGRHNHFTPQVQRPDRNFQRNRPIAHRHALLHAQELRHSSLEFLHQWPVITQPAPVKNIVDIAQKRLPATQIRSAHMQRLRERRWCATDR